MTHGQLLTGAVALVLVVAAFVVGRATAPNTSGANTAAAHPRHVPSDSNTSSPSSSSTATSTSTSTSTTGVSTTTAPVAPPCTDAVLFPIVAQAEPSASPTNVSLSTPIVAYCANGWAVLHGFTVQAGSGNGIALFDQSGSTWQFNMLGDDSGVGPGYDPCSQYPPAALAALGAQLCSG
jgi:hypothetical protein